MDELTLAVLKTEMAEDRRILGQTAARAALSIRAIADSVHFAFGEPRPAFSALAVRDRVAQEVVRRLLEPKSLMIQGLRYVRCVRVGAVV